MSVSEAAVAAAGIVRVKRTARRMATRNVAEVVVVTGATGKTVKNHVVLEVDIVKMEKTAKSHVVLEVNTEVMVKTAVKMVKSHVVVGVNTEAKVARMEVAINRDVVEVEREVKGKRVETKRKRVVAEANLAVETI